AILETPVIVQSGTTVTTVTQRSVRIVYNRLNRSLNDLVTTITSLPFSVDGVPESIGRVGKTIFIPLDSVD
ncbi:MAG: hypothetical protein K8I30_11460, partial [Anaerolineae bacterium]|nr:hypothetical protein [Anaerolineae bacterium]